MSATDFLHRDSESLALELEADNGYRVLRRLHVETTTDLPEPDDALRLGIFADVETTSLDTKTASIIELALVPFMFTPHGAVLLIGTAYDSFNDPGIPIPDEIQMLTGITDETVRGEAIDWTAVQHMVEKANLVVAHKASYDRPILERHCEAFASKAFACSMEDVDWRATFDAPCRTLGHLLEHVCGKFHSAHRAADDCYAGIHLLAAGVRDQRTAMSYLLESARQPTVRIFATNSPFHAKDTLKLRGYYWNVEKKVWFRDVTPDDEAAELLWLGMEADCPRPTVKKFTARDRYSVRVT